MIYQGGRDRLFNGESEGYYEDIVNVGSKDFTNLGPGGLRIHV